MTQVDTGALFEPLDVRGLTLRNRIVMAPMTRNSMSPPITRNGPPGARA